MTARLLELLGRATRLHCGARSSGAACERFLWHFGHHRDGVRTWNT